MTLPFRIPSGPLTGSRRSRLSAWGLGGAAWPRCHVARGQLSTAPQRLGPRKTPGGEAGGERAAPGVGRVAAASARERPIERLRVAVVEDEAVIAIEIEDLLLGCGAEVVGTAMSADEAVRLAETVRPDCMTMDIRLQGERDGISAAVEIYQRFGIRCIFVSAYNDPGTVARGEQARPFSWVAKPIRPDVLVSSLRLAGKNRP